MPAPNRPKKAQLQPITWDEQHRVVTQGAPMSVQFNPETLRVSYSNKAAGAGQQGGAAKQYVRQGSTKMSLDLWFDVTAPEPDRPTGSVDDVRLLTERVIRFMKPRSGHGKSNKPVPPGVRFHWGNFLFDGVVDSINESLEFFSEEGKPLRAKLSLSLSRQDLGTDLQDTNAADGGSPSDPTATTTGSAPATTPLRPARENDSVQSAAARDGRQDEWQSIALQNDIDNPRQLPAGLPLDTRGRSLA